MGFRLVYRVNDDVVYVTVITPGKRDKLTVYGAVKNRL
jgi:mRNA interferase RelE/StbE